MITVTAYRPHTHRGEQHQPGDVYEIEQEDLDSLVGQGMVVANEDTPPYWVMYGWPPPADDAAE
jgi:hypothetical protein